MNLNPKFMKDLFELRKSSRPVCDQYKLNLDIPKCNQATFGTKSLRFLGTRVWNSLPLHIKSAENLKSYQKLEWSHL